MLRRLFPLCVCLFIATAALRAETFQNPRHIVVPGVAGYLGSADFNGDGHPDFYSVDSITDIYVNPHLNIELWQPGDTYSTPISVPLPQPTPICRAVDLNKDHFADLVCYSDIPRPGLTNINILLGNGDGTFQPPHAINFNDPGSNGSMAFLAAGDINGDGHIDVVMIDAAGQLFTFLGDGAGNFPTYKVLQLTQDFVPRNTNAVLADVNHDGHLDLLLGGPIVFLGQGDGSFALSSSLQSGPANPCAFADMNDDGQLDSVCLNAVVSPNLASETTALFILKGLPDGTFDPNPILNTPAILTDFSGPAKIADLNGDGIPDIIAHSNDGLVVMLGRPGLTFAPPVHYAFSNFGGINPFQEDPSLFADFNGDGILDLAAPGPNGIYIAYGRPDGAFDAPPAFQSGAGLAEAVAADFDGDGLIEVITSGNASLMLNSGRGDATFQPAVPVTLQNNPPNGPPGIALLKGDFNGDGKPDLLNASASDDAYSRPTLFFNLGKGEFRPVDPTISSSASSFITIGNNIGVADLNGDRRDDLMQSDQSPSSSQPAQFNAYLSNGDGSFKRVSTDIPIGLRGFSYYDSAPAAADLNEDGKMDVVVASNDTVQILLGHGDGSFTVGTPVPVPSINGSPVTYIPAVVTGDFDHDGHQDFAVLATANGYYGNEDQFGPTALIVFYGRGDGTFAPGVVAATLDNGYQSLAAADLNHDGLTDFVISTNTTYSARSLGDAIAIIHSQPGRTFSGETNLIAGPNISSLAIADFNQDGNPDLMVASSSPGNFAMFWPNDFTILLNHSGPYVQGTLTSAPEPSTVAQPFTLTATLTPYLLTSVPTGSISFSIDGQPAGSGTLANASASVSVTQPLARGTHTLGANWPGDAHYPGITLSAIHIVTGITTSLALASAPNPSPLGTAVQLTSTLSATPQSGTPPPTGTLTLADNGTVFASLPISGSLPIALAAAHVFTAAGPHTLSAAYSGDALYNPASATLLQTVSALTSQTTLTSAPNPSTFGQTITFTASASITSSAPVANPLGGATFTLSGLPAGTITLPATLSSAASATSSTASAVYQTAALPAGTYTLTASFSGNANAAPSASSPLTQTVSAAASSVLLTSGPNPAYQGQNVTLSARLVASASASGSIRFLDGSTLLASVPLAGNATASFSTNALTVGQHSLTAAYSGDTNDLAAASSPLTQTILPSDFTLTPGITSLTLISGHHTTFKLSALSIGAFADSVTLSAAAMPQFATMQFTPAAMPLTAGSSGSTSIYFDTDAVLGFYSRNHPPSGSPQHGQLPFALAGLLLLLLPRKQRRRLTLLTFLAAAVLLSSLTGCADRYPGKVAPGNYILHITGTGSHTGLTHTLDLPLTVTAK